jgi:hypothetical protein
MPQPIEPTTSPDDRSSAVGQDAYAAFWDCVEDSDRPPTVAPAAGLVTDGSADAYQLFLDYADAD